MKLITLVGLFVLVASAVAETSPTKIPPMADPYAASFWAKNPRLWEAHERTERAAATAQRMNGFPRTSNHTYHNKGCAIFDENGRWVCNQN